MLQAINFNCYTQYEQLILLFFHALRILNIRSLIYTCKLFFNGDKYKIILTH